MLDTKLTSEARIQEMDAQLLKSPMCYQRELEYVNNGNDNCNSSYYECFPSDSLCVQHLTFVISFNPPGESVE